MKQYREKVFAFIVWITCLSPLTALGEGAPIDLLAKLKFGAGGAVNAELSVPELFAQNPTGDDTILPTLGFSYGVEFPLQQWISIGVLNDFDWWNSHDFDKKLIGRSFLFNLDAFVRFNHVINPDVQVFFLLPVGLTLGSIDPGINDLTGLELSRQLGVDLTYNNDMGVGWNISALVGAAYQLSPQWRGFVELGWTRWDVSYDSATSQGQGKTNFVIDQFTLNTGFAFALDTSSSEQARDWSTSDAEIPPPRPNTSHPLTPLQPVDTPMKKTSEREVTIQASECNLRAAPDRKGKVVKKLIKGVKCSALENKENWYKVSCQESLGYIHEVCLGE